MRRIGELMDLRGRKALVAGGTGHLALAAEEALVELGAQVGIMDIDASLCEKRARELNSVGEGSSFSCPCDLSDEQDSRAALRRAVESMGGLDILIHCAAWVGTTEKAGWAVPLEQQTVSAWDQALRINLTSAFVLAQESMTWLKRSPSGTMVLVGSIYGVVGPQPSLYEGTSLANPTAYGVSKGGIVQLTRYLATQLAPQVRVNCISPGGVGRGQPTEFVKRYEERTPLGRVATEEDFKGAVAYLSSDLSRYVTGHDLFVDGGWTAW